MIYQSFTTETRLKSMSCFPIDAIVAENQPGGIIIQLGILACFR
jgi:hypothetical protein